MNFKDYRSSDRANFDMSRSLYQIILKSDKEVSGSAQTSTFRAVVYASCLIFWYLYGVI